MLQFTGSDRVGKIVASECAKFVKPYVLELGGKNPAVVLDDADLETAARAIAQGALANSGQVCMSTDRVIVQRRAAETLVPRLQEIFAKVRAGDPSKNANVTLAPMLNEVLAESVVTMLRDAREEGAEVVLGDVSRDGAVVQPHILRGVRPGMRAWDRESFGPGE